MGQGKIIKTFVSNSVILAIWENPVKKNGMELTMRNITIKKMYKKNEGESWQYFDNFRDSELPDVLQVINQYFESKKNNQ